MEVEEDFGGNIMKHISFPYKVGQKSPVIAYITPISQSYIPIYFWPFMGAT